MIESPRPTELPPVPAEVAAFAQAQGAAGDVQTVLAMTRRLFPAATIRLRLEDDSDVSDRHILVEVEAQGYDDTRVVMAQTEWADELFRQCPSSSVCVFRLALV